MNHLEGNTLRLSTEKTYLKDCPYKEFNCVKMELSGIYAQIKIVMRVICETNCMRRMAVYGTANNLIKHGEVYFVIPAQHDGKYISVSDKAGAELFWCF